MTETYTESEMMRALKYIQKKERLLSALNSAIRTAEAPIYAQELNELMILLIQDKLLPNSMNTWAIEGLYRNAQPETENKDGYEDP